MPCRVPGSVCSIDGMSVRAGNRGLFIVGPFSSWFCSGPQSLYRYSAFIMSSFLSSVTFVCFLLALLLLWKALAESEGFFWLCTDLWVMCSARFSCIMDYYYYYYILAASQENVPGDDESSLFHRFACLLNAPRSISVEQLIPSSYWVPAFFFFFFF